MTRKAAGIGLIIIAAALAATVIISVGNAMPQTGPWIGKITQYHQPFYGHGLVMIALGLASAVSFLSGLFMLAMHRK